MSTILIPMEDAIIHTDSHPYCSQLDCPCRIVPALMTRCDTLVTDLDRYTARLVEIAADTTLDHPTIRKGVIAECAIIAIWAHTEDPALKAALDRLMNAFTLVK